MRKGVFLSTSFSTAVDRKKTGQLEGLGPNQGLKTDSQTNRDDLNLQGNFPAYPLVLLFAGRLPLTGPGKNG